MKEITREIEVGSAEGAEVKVVETKEDAGMFEIEIRYPNGDFKYKHLTAIEVVKLVEESYKE